MATKSRKPRNILFFDHTAQPGGGELALLNLVQHIDRKLFTPLVVLGSHGVLEHRLRTAGIETIVMLLTQSVAQTRKDTLGARSLWRVADASSVLLYAIRLAGLLRRRRIRILHANSLKADLIGSIAARIAGVAIVWHVRDRIADDYLPPKIVKLFRWLSSWLPDAVVANSQATMDTIFPTSSFSASSKRKQNRKRPLRRVLYSGVVLRWRHDDDIETRFEMTMQRYKKDADETGARRDADDEITVAQRHAASHRVLDTKAPRIGLIGRISSWKGQHVFVDAAAIVRRRYPGAKFLIVGAPLFGEEDYEKSVREMVRARDLDDSVEWLGFREDVDSVIESLDILVHASTISEPFGQVVVQGMAAGKPVVATRGGGVSEIVQDGLNGLLADRNCSDSLSKAILRILDDPQNARRMGIEARRSVIRKFTIERTARGAEALYRAMLTKTR